VLIDEYVYQFLVPEIIDWSASLLAFSYERTYAVKRLTQRIIGESRQCGIGISAYGLGASGRQQEPQYWPNSAIPVGIARQTLNYDPGDLFRMAACTTKECGNSNARCPYA
jgi:hypothetical protein